MGNLLNVISHFDDVLKKNESDISQSESMNESDISQSESMSESMQYMTHSIDYKNPTYSLPTHDFQLKKSMNRPYTSQTNINVKNPTQSIPTFNFQLVIKTTKSKKKTYYNLNSFDNKMPRGVVHTFDLRHGMRVQIVNDDHRSILGYKEVVPTHQSLEDFIVDMADFFHENKQDVDTSVRRDHSRFEVITECIGYTDVLFYRNLVDSIIWALNYAIVKDVAVVTFQYVSAESLNSEMELDSIDTYCTTLLKILLNFDYQNSDSVILVRILSSKASFINHCQENFLRYFDTISAY